MAASSPSTSETAVAGAEVAVIECERREASLGQPLSVLTGNLVLNTRERSGKDQRWQRLGLIIRKAKVTGEAQLVGRDSHVYGLNGHCHGLSKAQTLQRG